MSDSPQTTPGLTPLMPVTPSPAARPIGAYVAAGLLLALALAWGLGEGLLLRQGYLPAALHDVRALAWGEVAPCALLGVLLLCRVRWARVATIMALVALLVVDALIAFMVASAIGSIETMKIEVGQPGLPFGAILRTFLLALGSATLFVTTIIVCLTRPSVRRAFEGR